MKYVLVTGGVISGIGKGIVSSSLGTLLKACGLRVTSIKIDPYINIDAGTFSPYEHGEVFVLDDGGEVDLDLGNYERFLDVTLHSDNNITTGKIYQHVIKKERQGDYLGKTVQVVPHITNAIQEWVERVAHVPVDDTKLSPEVCIVELGGTVGDIESMPFIEAFRQFQFRVGKSNFACTHVSLVPSPQTTGEQKTKPTQMSVRELRGLGLTPDLLFCRSNSTLAPGVREKLSMFCHVVPENVIGVPDVDSLYRVPLLLEEEKVHEILLKHFGVPSNSSRPRRFLSKWRKLADLHDNTNQQVRIVLVGKYVQLEDSYVSMVKALQHAAIHAKVRLQLQYVSAEELEESFMETDPVAFHRSWERLCSAHGVLVAGGFGNRGVEGKVSAIGWCRKNDVPMLGVCLGLQCAVIEFARSELGWSDANSTEFAPESQHPVVLDMPEFNPDEKGGTMRLGRRNTIFRTKDSLMRKMYGNVDKVEERHRHRFEVNPKVIKDLENRGLKFTGESEDGQRMEILELASHRFFVGVQYHPEFLSRPLRPSPPYLGLILAGARKLKAYLRRGCRIPPRHDSYYDEEDDSEDEEGATECHDSHGAIPKHLEERQVTTPVSDDVSDEVVETGTNVTDRSDYGSI